MVGIDDAKIDCPCKALCASCEYDISLSMADIFPSRMCPVLKFLLLRYEQDLFEWGQHTGGRVGQEIDCIVFLLNEASHRERVP